MADERSLSPSPERPPGGPELRLLDRRAFVGFPPLDVAAGVVVSDFALQVPDVTFPFNVSGGASRFQRQKLLFGELEVTVSAEVLRRKLSEAAGRVGGLSDVALHLRAGYLEGEAKLAAAGGAPVTFKVALDGYGPDLGAWVYDVRLYAPAATPAAAVPALMARALVELDVLPEVKLRGASGFTARVLPRLSELAAVSRGFKAPEVERAQLAHVEVTPAALVLRFTASGIPPAATPDESLLLQLEGTRAFADAEALLAGGRWDEARQAWLRAGDVADAHPFAVERLLQLLVADPAAEALALDVAELLAARRPKAAAPLWAEAVLRERRGEKASAAGRYLALAVQARAAGELASAFLAAEAAARTAAGVAPGLAVRALHELLGLQPDHLPALLALARAADASGDRASSLRAWRRVSALARDTRVAAEAHVQLARLSAAGAPSELSAARLHCEAALRLQPDLPDALHLLGELCLRAGEPLRALRALDRLREVALGQHALEQVADASLLAGRAWETGPGQLDNALLRYREALSLRPADARAALGVARVAERLGRWQEALAAAQQVVELAGPEPVDPPVRQASHEAWHILARLYEGQLKEPARARDALSAALALDARDAAALSVLVPAFRAEGRAEELADALEKLARLTGDGEERAALAVEAGELHRVRLGRLDAAARLYALALEAQPRHRPALEGMLAVAEATRDGDGLCRALRALSSMEPVGPARNRLLRRLAAAARELSGDLAVAAQALSELLLHEPLDLAALGELKELLRRRGEVSRLSDVLAARARAAEQLGEVRLAAGALRELAELQSTRLGDRAAATESLGRALRLLPEPAVVLEYASAALAVERPAAAREALVAALEAGPVHVGAAQQAELRARLGEALEALGDPDGAREQCVRAFPGRPLDEPLFLRLERLHRGAGLERELAHLQGRRAEALRLAGRHAEAGAHFLEAGRTLAVHGDRAGAAQWLADAESCAPGSRLADTARQVLPQVSAARSALGLPRVEPRGAEASRPEVGTSLSDAAQVPLHAELPAGPPPRVDEPGMAHAREPVAAVARALASLGLPRPAGAAVVHRAGQVREEDSEVSGAPAAASDARGVPSGPLADGEPVADPPRELGATAGAAPAGVPGTAAPREDVPATLAPGTPAPVGDATASARAEAAALEAERAGDDASAAELWMRAADAATDDARRSNFLVRVLQARRADVGPALEEVYGKLVALELRRGRVEAAGELLGEQAQLFELAGQAGPALEALARLRALKEDAGEVDAAVALELQRAGLFRDAKFDLAAAEESLLHAFELKRSLEVARMGAELARRREDVQAEADWLDRQLLVEEAPSGRALTLLQLARLFLGPLSAPKQAAAAAAEALRLDGSLAEARALLASAEGTRA